MWIKPFRVDQQAYVYSAWTNQIARVSPALYELLTNGASEDSKCQEAIRLGLLPEGTHALEIYPEPMIEQALTDLASSGPAHLVLTVTEACNYRCRYCAYSGAYRYARRHSQRRMPEHTAIKAVHWYLRFRRDHFHIGFYGGEPLLLQLLIERVVREARSALPKGATLSFGMTTNGWLLGDKTIDFLAKHGFELFVSLDGPAAIHDRYRRTVGGQPTFARVWDQVVRIWQRHPEYFSQYVNFSITLAPPNALSELTAFVEQNHDIFAGKVPKVGLLNNATSQVMERLGVVSPQDKIDLTSLRERYLEHMVNGSDPDGLSRACAEASMARLQRRSMTAVATVTSSGGQCVPGTRCHVSVDGNLHMCEHGDEHFSIGHVDIGLDESAIRSLLQRFRRLIERHCQNCWALRLCSKCIPHLAEGGMLSRDRLKTMCAAYCASLERDLADYCRARSLKDDCFASLGERANRAVSTQLN